MRGRRLRRDPTPLRSTPVTSPSGASGYARDLPAGARPRPLTAIVRVAEKDLRTDLRARNSLQAALFFAVAAVLLFSFALGPERPQLGAAAPGLVWIGSAFAAVFALGRSFAAERDAGTLETLLLFPVAREALFLGKLLANAAAVLVLTLVALGFMFVLYALPAPADPARLAAALVLGVLGLAAAGVFYGALSVRLAVREAFLPVLVLPLVLPLVIAASRGTAEALAGGPPGPWLGLLLVFDAVVVTAATLLFRYLVES